MTGKEALIAVLKENGGGPMKVKDLTEQAVKRAKGLKGKTPTATLAARLYTDKATFKKTGRGMVSLTPAAKADKPAEEVADVDALLAGDESKDAGETLNGDLQNEAAAAAGDVQVTPDEKPAGRKRTKQAAKTA